MPELTMQKRQPRVPRAIFVAAALLLVFAAIAWAVSEGRTTALDREVILGLRNLAGSSGPAWLDETVRNITSLGSVIVVCLLAGTFIGYLALCGERGSAILLLVSVLGGIALNELLKMIFDRPRPDLALPSVRVFSSSFPSGHAVLSCVAYLTIGTLIAHRATAARIGVYVMSVAVFLVLLIGTTRVYLGVHYPSDVLAGWCIGTFWVLACWQVAEFIEHRQSQNGRHHR
jgi:undecaprenyl-diphosphatase